MAISLGGVTLCKDLIWEAPMGHPNRAYSRRVTLLGKIIVQHSPISGREISLTTVSTANGSIGYYLKSQLDELRVFEKAVTEIPFIYESESLQVIIAPGGIDVTPLVPRPGPASTDYYTGSVQLIEI